MATWNIDNFSDDAATARRIATLILQMDLDLVAVQEVADVNGFNKILAGLADYDGVLSDHQYSNGQYQKAGFIFKKELIELIEVFSLFEDEGYIFPRPPLQANFRVTRPNGRRWIFAVIDVHLKASDSAQDKYRRRQACAYLKNHVDQLLISGKETEVFVLGDFNDLLTDKGYENVFRVFMDDPDNYQFTTLELAQNYEYSHPWTRRIIDHILISRGLFNEYQGGFSQVVKLDWMIEDYTYLEEVSDHRPVVALFPW
jgi:endonuclease/exonuclease/phosphatase family metal-dependent hydrolase